ncbi:MAG: hypothetical protein J6Y02_08200 [Pseudobutyrivibrio sp.]|nr:hypothetical protein [Pseudobutyrivibrio sp.]
MAKLCYKINGTVKEYDLKDNVSRVPKLGVKVGGTTKYLGLKQGTKSGELTVRFNGLPYYIQTWGPDDSLYWNLDAAPEKGCGGTAGDTTHGGCAIWTLRNSEGYLVATIGRIAADRPDDSNLGFWVANKKVVTLNTTPHTGYAKPYIRIVTVPFGMGNDCQWKPTNTPANIYSNLTNSKYTIDGFSKNLYLSQYSTLGDAGTNKSSVYSCGANAINRVLTDSEVNAGRTSVGGMTNYNGDWLAFTLSCGKTSSTTPIGMPCLSMYGLQDSGGHRYVHVNGYYSWNPHWAVRDFYIEWPQVQRLEYTPKQVLNAWKEVLQAEDKWQTNFGTCYGRNY